MAHRRGSPARARPTPCCYGEACALRREHAEPRRQLRLDHPHLLRATAQRARERYGADAEAARARGAPLAAVALAAAAATEGHAANPPAQPYSSAAPRAGAWRGVTPATIAGRSRPTSATSAPARHACWRGRALRARDRAPRPRRRARRVADAPTRATSRSAPPTAPSATSTPRSTAVPGGLPGGDPLAGLHRPAPRRARALEHALDARRRRARGAALPRDVARLRAQRRAR